MGGGGGGIRKRMEKERNYRAEGKEKDWRLCQEDNGWKKEKDGGRRRKENG